MKKPSPFSYRPAEFADVSKVVALVNSAYRGESSYQGWTTEADFLAGQRTDSAAIAELIAKPSCWILICEEQRRLIASVNLEKKDDQVCYFGMFAVDPAQQNRGVGKAFVQAAESFARDKLHCSAMEMTVITIRQELISWYERLGYRFTGEIREFPYGDERFGIPLRDDLKLGVWRKSLV